MSRFEIYRARAERCEVMAGAATNELERENWSALATAWAKLADTVPKEESRLASAVLAAAASIR